MDPGSTIRDARRRAGLTQEALAGRAGTSQATISMYERGAKDPAATTLDRILTACGEELRVDGLRATVRRPHAADLDRAGRTFEEVLQLAALLPTRHEPTLRFPRLPVSGRA